MGKFAPEVIEAVKSVGKAYNELNVVAITNGYNNDLFDAALNLYERVGCLIETLEQNDENMDPARTKLPNLDEVFAGDPVSEYVDTLIKYASGSGKIEDVRAATKKLADHQNSAKYEGFCSEYPTEPVVDQEELFNQLHPEEVKTIHISEWLEKYGFGDLDPNEVLDNIQEILDRRTDKFADTDHKLIRFYLKHKPFNTAEEIDSLSDRALELAWKQYKYARKFM